MKPVQDFFGGIHAAFSSPQVRILVSLTAILIFLGALFYRWAEGWSWLDAVYFSVITISTVGYGDFSPQTSVGKLFTIFYVICGLGLFVSMASAIADNIIDRTKSRNHDE